MIQQQNMVMVSTRKLFLQFLGIKLQNYYFKITIKTQKIFHISNLITKTEVSQF